MPVPFDLLRDATLTYVLTLAVLMYVGYGVTALVLPRSLRADGLYFVPFVGYTALSVVFHWLNITLFSGYVVFWIMIAAATILNLAVIVRRQHLPRVRPDVFVTQAILVAASYYAGLVPLFDMGQLTAIARNFDIMDIYNATAEYVISYPVFSIPAEAPPNPLIYMVMNPNTLTNGWGMSYLHAVASMVTGLTTIATQPAVVSLMHALIIPAGYLFCRWALNILNPWLAMIAGVVLSLVALLVAMLFFGLGNHIVMLSLFPIVLLSTFVAFTEPSRRGIVFAGLMLANLPLTYWSTYPIFLPMPLLFIALLGVYEFVQHWRVARPLPRWFSPRWLFNRPGGLFYWWVRLSTIFALVGLVSLPFGAEGYRRMFNNFVASIAPKDGKGFVPSNGWGGDEMVDLAAAGGFSYWTWPATPDLRIIFAEPWASLIGGAATPALVITLLFAAIAFIRLSARQRIFAASVGLAFVLLLVYMRFVSVYYYGYLKLTTFTSVLVVGLAIAGIATAWNWAGRRRWAVRLPTRLVLTTVSLAQITLILISSFMTTDFFVGAPATYKTGTVVPTELLNIDDLTRVIPPGSDVFVSESPPMRPEAASVVSYFLRDYPLYGNIITLESKLKNPPPRGAVPDYGVLAAAEDPETRGYDVSDLIWSNADLRVYKRGLTVAYLPFRGAETPILAPRTPYRFVVSPDGFVMDGKPVVTRASTQPDRQLIVEFASLVPTSVQMTVGDNVHSLSLPAGLSRYETSDIDLPSPISLTSEGPEPVFIRSMMLRQSDAQLSQLTSKRPVLVLAPSVGVTGSVIDLRFRLGGAEPWVDRRYAAVAGINIGGKLAGTGEWTELGWWGLSLEDIDTTMRLDLATLSATSRADLNAQPLSRLRDGEYTAILNIWQTDLSAAGWRTPFYDLFTFKVVGGKVTNVEVVADPVLYVTMRHNYRLTSPVPADLRNEATAILAKIPKESRVLLGVGLQATPNAVALLVSGLPRGKAYADYAADANFAQPGVVYDYAVLSYSDDERVYGYAPSDLVAGGSTLRLFRRGEASFHLDLQFRDRYPKIANGSSFTVFSDGAEVSRTKRVGVGSPMSATNGQLVITLASLFPSSIDLNINGGTARRLALGGGLYRYTTEALTMPADVTLTSQSNVPVFILAVDLVDSKRSGAQLIADPEAMVIGTSLEPMTNGLGRVRLRWASGGPASRQFWMGLNINGYAASDGQWFSHGWWGMPMSAADIEFVIDLPTGNFAGEASGVPVTTSSWQTPLRAGNYSAELSFWERDLYRQGWQTPFVELFSFQVNGSQQIISQPNDVELKVIALGSSTPPAR